MKRLLLLPFLLILSMISQAQSETHDFITYDTVYTESGGGRWVFHITRPANMFTTNHPDTASRPAIIMMQGAGEIGSSNTDTTNMKTMTSRYGPHYWMNNGWDGGIQLANGKHYPIIITIVPSYINPRAPAVYTLLTHILNTYHIKGNSVHVTGLSMGGFTWSKLIVYEASAGAETGMKLIKSFTALQGVSNETFAPYNAWSRSWNAFGRWAVAYDGRFFGLEGTRDSRNVRAPRNAIRDSLAFYSDTNTAYFAMENIGDVGSGNNHCCWNDMYDPSRHNWNAYPKTDMGDNIVWNTQSGWDNTNGTYQKGWNLFEWMIRQGDTTLVTGVPGAPVANAGPDQNITATSVTLNSSSSSGTITSRTWSRISGPNTPTITSPSSTSTSVTGLINGTYVFQISVTDGTNTSTDQVTVTKTDPANTPPVVSAGVDRSKILADPPADSVHMSGSASDPDGSISSQTWTQVSGPNTATIVSPNSLTTTISGLIAGTYTFRLSATDNSGATVTDEIAVLITDPGQVTSLRIKVRWYNGISSNLFNQGEWNNVYSATTPHTISLFDENGNSTSVSMTAVNFNAAADNGAGYGGWTGGEPVWPDEVMRWLTYYQGTGTRTITLSGLNPASQYDLYLLATRVSSSNTTTFSVGETVKGPITTLNNKSTQADFTGVTPASDGTITVNVTKTGTSYVNGFILVQQGSGPAINQPPIVTGPGNLTLTLPTNSVSPTVTAVDPEGEDLVYNWSITPSATISDPTVINPTISGLSQGTYQVTFSATDTGAITRSVTFNIIVNAAGNQLPVVNAGSDQNVSLTGASTSTTVTATASDPDGTIVGRLWEKVSGPAGETIVFSNQLSTQISGLVAGQYQFRFTATDNNGGTKSDTIAINVSVASVDTLPSIIVGEGEYQVYYIAPNRDLWALGNITNLGNSAAQNGIPIKVAGSATGKKFKVTAGGLHGGAAIDFDGNVHVMGDNDQAQRGLGNFLTSYNNATQIMSDSLDLPFTSIKDIVGGYHQTVQSNFFLALKENGDIYIWGKVLGGLLGNGTDSVTWYITRPWKIQMPGGRSVKQIYAGNTIMVLCTDGTVWTWGRVGNYANLGYAGTGFDYRTPRQVTFPGNPTIARILGGGAFNYALDVNGILYGWGAASNYMGDLTFPTGNGAIYSTPRVLTNILNALPAKIVDIALDFAATHVVLENGDLYGWGDDAQSGVGDGGSLNWPDYGWAWPGTAGMKFVKLPVQIAPGIKFSRVYGGNCYVYYRHALTQAGELYAWGRNKANVINNKIVIASSTLAADKQNLADVKWPRLIDPFTSTTAYLSTSPDCVDGTSTGSPCNTYSIPANVKPTANAGSNQNISLNHTTLNGSSSTDNVFIGWWEWKQVSGPSVATISTPGNPITQISNLTDGSYVFRLVVEDNGRLKDSTTMTVTVGQSGNVPPVIDPIPNPSVQLPSASVTLTAVASDADGSIASYQWTKVSGPNGGNISTPNSAQTLITNLQAGTYVFNVKVLDNGGQETNRQVSVIVTAIQDGRKKYFQINVIKKQI